MDLKFLFLLVKIGLLAVVMYFFVTMTAVRFNIQKSPESWRFGVEDGRTDASKQWKWIALLAVFGVVASVAGRLLDKSGWVSTFALILTVVFSVQVVREAYNKWMVLLGLFLFLVCGLGVLAIR